MNRRWMFAAAAAAALAMLAPIRARAQDAPQPKERAPLVVDGRVKGVYRDAKADRVEILVELEASRVGTPGAPIDDGEAVYVHVHQAVGREGGYKAVPAEGAWIRAYLYPRGTGWQGAFPDWFDPRPAPEGPQGRPGGPAAPGDSASPREAGPSSASGKTILGRFGVKADPVETGGRLILKVTGVLPGTPAEAAGFEKGDVVVGVNKSGFASLQQFADLLSQGPAKAEFVVLNVRTNEQATVQVDVSAIVNDGAPRRPAPSPAAPKRSLGAELEPARQGRRSGLKVTSVRPGGPAQKAGFEVGDVLVAAGGAPLPDEAALQRAVDAAGAELIVLVLDGRTGKEFPVEVPLGPPGPGAGPSPTPAPTPGPGPDSTPAAGGANSRRLGLTVKPGTADLLPVVKVASVAPGSPAAKAGVEVGDAIVGVDDRVVFAPDLFEEALKSVGPTFTLTVLDVKSGKKTPVKVDLGR